MHEPALENDELKDRMIGGLVDVLREIHAARVSGDAANVPTALPGLLVPMVYALATAGLRRHRDPATDFTTLSDALDDLIRASRLPELRRPVPEEATLYEALRRRIRQAEAAAAERNHSIDRLLRGAGADPAKITSPAPLVQETVYLQCRRGGRTAGRFRCINQTNQRVHARVRSGSITSPGGGLVEGAEMSVHPRDCALGPGELLLVTVAVDLGGCATLASDRIEGFADVEIDGASTLKVWIAVSLYDPIA